MTTATTVPAADAAPATGLPAFGTPEAYEAAAIAYRALHDAPTLSGAQAHDVIVTIGRSLVGWSNMGKVVTRALKA